MEVIELSSYIEDEKVQIAQRYLLPKQLKEHGLGEKQVYKMVAEGIILCRIQYLQQCGGWIAAKICSHFVNFTIPSCRLSATIPENLVCVVWNGSWPLFAVKPLGKMNMCGIFFEKFCINSKAIGNTAHITEPQSRRFLHHIAQLASRPFYRVAF